MPRSDQTRLQVYAGAGKEGPTIAVLYSHDRGVSARFSVSYQIYVRRRPKVDMQPERALKMTQKENKVHYVSTDHPSCQVGLLEVFQEGDAI